MDAGFERRRSFAGENLAALFLDCGAIGLVDHAMPERQVGVVILRSVARHGDAAWAMGGLDGASILEEDIIRVVGDGFEKVFVVLLAFLKGVVGTVPLDRVRNRPREGVTIDAPFDEVVLGSFAHGLDGESLIIHTAEDDDGHVGNTGLQRLESFEPMTVGQAQVGEDHIEVFVAKSLETFSEMIDADQFEVRGSALGKEEAQEARIDRAILNQQNFDGWFHAQIDDTAGYPENNAIRKFRMWR